MGTGGVEDRHGGRTRLARLAAADRDEAVEAERDAGAQQALEDRAEQPDVPRDARGAARSVGHGMGFVDHEIAPSDGFRMASGPATGTRRKAPT